AFRRLPARARGRDQAGGQGGRARGQGVALDDQYVGIGFARREPRRQPGGPGADDDPRHRDGKRDTGSGADPHVCFRAARRLAQSLISTTLAREAMVASCTASLNAAQPSDSTIAWKSRTWASRTVEATPPLVTMPAKMRVSMPARRSTNSIRLM